MIKTYISIPVASTESLESFVLAESFMAEDVGLVLDLIFELFLVVVSLDELPDPLLPLD
jgi:hypothetical protein